MGQIANMTLADGVTPTPVNRTFAAISGQMGETVSSYWAERTAGRFGLFVRMQQLVRRSQGKVPANVVKIALVLPEASVTDPSVAAYTAKFTGDFVIPDGLSAQGRKDLIAYVANYLQTQVAKDAIEGLPAH